ncbi:hypothetical protein [uncultured Gammaproteobacteria bacterium]|uniref:redoxin domain-containing protein n=1 Tax=Bathymodiolus heckerae thiotrophic gill symbiont TaxID=1052212 RepID=UPI0010B59940|nr:redoxin domain-containing protein [Bathymodiolus heckerae thiotrophic gill symbiont]CAC9607441.1 hypothetical protein [uncultured Gammaproteobacteria bacterium]CAC9958366.1 hypothetical protein [uncultured Gammaproteobacteria bacterium]SHN89447.1 hypothetical protein BHECKSOX_1768 [Bathymodiolus heckerae thiotrophic gill symbiont]
MVSTETPICEFSALAINFKLKGVDGKMQKISNEMSFTFSYLIDETQAVAKAYGAVCTPDFFGYNTDLKLQYRGRLDASRKQSAAKDVKRDLFEAMEQVAKTGKGPLNQIPSMGCSIKWI